MSDNDPYEDLSPIPSNDDEESDHPLLSYEFRGIYGLEDYCIPESCENSANKDILPDYDSLANLPIDEAVVQITDLNLTKSASKKVAAENNNKLTIPEEKKSKVIEKNSYEEIIKALNSPEPKRRAIRNIPLYHKDGECFKCNKKYDMNYCFCYCEDERTYVEGKPLICYWCSLHVKNLRMIRDWEGKPKQKKNVAKCYRCNCLKSKCRLKVVVGKDNKLCTCCSLKTKRRYDLSRMDSEK